MPWTYVKHLPGPELQLAGATCDAPSPSAGQWVYAIGGWSSAGVDAVPAAYNPLTNAWQSIASMGLIISGLAATATRGQLHALGGYEGVAFTQGPVGTHQIYDPATDSWLSAPPMPTARYWHAAVTGPDGLIYAIGGFGASALSATVEAYDPDAEAWHTKASLLTPRAFLAAVTFNGLIFAIGGLGGAPEVLASVEVYDPSTDGPWEPGPSLPAPRAGLAATVGPDGVIYAIGGVDRVNPPGPAQSAVYSYALLAPDWATQDTLLTPQALLAAATGPDGRIYAMGGTSNPDQFTPLDTVEAFTVTTPMTAPDPYIGGSSAIILSDSNGAPVPIAPAYLSWQPSKQYGISAIVYNDSNLPAPNTTVGFWLFINVPKGKPPDGVLIDQVTGVTVPANGAVIVNSPTGARYQGLQGAGVAVSIANPESPYFKVAPTTAAEVISSQTVERPAGSGHYGAALRGYPDSCLELEAQLEFLSPADFSTEKEYLQVLRSMMAQIAECREQWGGPTEVVFPGVLR